jgi:uncharacterized protein YjiS (DUF1127 family)
MAEHSAALANIALLRRTRSRIPVWIRSAWAGLATWHERHRSAAHLRQLSDSQLRDLGITRLDIERAVRGQYDPSRRRRGLAA